MSRSQRWLCSLAVAGACGILLRHPPASAQNLESLALRKSDKGCTISAAPVSFGNYDVMNPSPLLGMGTITYSCGTQSGGADQGQTRSPVKNISIQLSRGSSSNYDRAMRQGADRLRYNLYLDASGVRIWGDGSQGTAVYTRSDPQNHHAYTVTIFGRVFERQDVSPGIYQDNITATILF
jgi:spore coat protein U-like protein